MPSMNQEQREGVRGTKRTLAAAGERAAVAQVLARLGASHPARIPWVIGPGDDAAALHLPPGEVAVLTTDTLVEGVHFERAWTSPEDLGYKLIQSATSDVGAVGARPVAALVAVSTPGTLAEHELLRLTDGMLEAARAHDLALAGGDTTQAPLLVITATILGSASPDALRTRSGARPGDRLAVTGELGDAAAGLLALKEIHAGESLSPATWLRPESALTGLERRLAARGFAGSAPAALAAAARRLLRPSPPIAGGALAAAAGATALIDISDGLASELGLIAEASGVGLVVEAGAVPVGAGARAWAARQGGDPLAFALDGGEDYELLIAVSSGHWASLKAALAAGGVRVTEIGEVVARQEGIGLRDATGKVRPLAPGGYEHFRPR